MKVRPFRFLRTRIGRRFLRIFLLISLIPLLLMRWLAIRRSEAAIQIQTLAELRSASDGAEAQVVGFLSDLKERLLHVAIDPRIRDALKQDAEQSSAELLQLLRVWVPSDVQELFVMNEIGQLSASSMTKSEHSYSPTDEFFIRGSQGFFAGDVLQDPGSGRLTWIMSAPVRDPISHTLLGVVGFRIDPAELTALTSGRRILSKGASSQSLRIGESGETYLVNTDGLMITESRHASNAVMRLKIDTLPVRRALDQSERFTGRYVDYRGAMVSGSSRLLRNPPWILITEIDSDQAFGPVRRLRYELVAATFVLVLLAVAVAWSSTWRVLNPIQLLGESDRALAERDESRAFVPEADIPHDELGELVRTRNSRVRAVLGYQRQLEERTEKLQEMINEVEHISYAIVHDMRAPLRAMQGFATLLESDGSNYTEEERRSYLKKISGAAIRLDQLIQDVLAYNRTVLRRMPLHPVDLNPLVRGVLDTYPDFSTEKTKIEITGTLPIVIGNEALLTQCFSNLLDNALKFSRPDVRPQIRIWSEVVKRNDPGASHMSPVRGGSSDACGANMARIWIEDNGIGIPKEAQSRIFTMFQQVTTDRGGTGVGLAIVHKVVEQMSGQVGVMSERGTGCRFWVDLPQASPKVRS